jgi:transposase
MSATPSISAAPAAEADPVVLRSVNAELSSQLADARRLIEALKHELLLLKHWRFGRHSEKNATDAMGSLFAEMAAAAPEEAAPAAGDATPREHASPKKKGHGRRTLPADLPVERIVVEPAPEEKVCPPCGAEKIVIGEEVRRELDYTPGALFVREYVRPVYACPRACEGQVVVAPPPTAPIEKGLPGPGLLAHVAVNKYVDHLPLARQEARLEREGLFVSRQTQCDWCAAAAHLLASFAALLREEVLRSKVLHTDDTPVTYLERGGAKPKTGRLWVYRGDRNHPYTFYTFSPTRQRTWPADVLAGWKGHLQADAFSGYDALYAAGGITEVACWAHARRKFKEAELSDGRRATPVVRRIAALYAVETSLREEVEKNGWTLHAPGDAGDRAEALRQRRRREEAAPLLETLRRELDALSLAVLPKSPLGQAVAYALKNWTALSIYAENGALAIDNNAAERELRPVAVGRKNYLFFGSARGGETAATLYTVLASAKRHGVEPWAYLRDLFGRLPTMKASALSALLPDHWRAAQPATPPTTPR